MDYLKNKLIKTRILNLTVGLYMTTLLSAFGQNVTASDLDSINGNWEGTLSYTDYGDDKTQYSLETNLYASWKSGVGKLRFEFKESNGKLVYSNEKIKLINDNQFLFDTKWDIVSFVKKGNSWTLILEASGQDNNKPSKLRQEINFEKSKLTISKMVMYNGTNSFFKRNGYEFTKID